MFTHTRYHFHVLGSMLFAILTVAAFTVSPVIRAQSSPDLVRNSFVPSNDVSFTISLAKSTFGVREEIPVKYRVENISNGALYIPRGFEVTACLGIGGPHIWGWFENSAGRHFEPGYGSSCAFGTDPSPTLTERMSKATVLLRPRERFDGTLQLDPRMFGGLPIGSYRIEAVLRGWKGDEFTDAQLAELAKMGNPFLRGEVPASVRITLIP